MKKLLFILAILPLFGLNAQIFINTNPNAKGTEGTIIKETKTVDETKKELETTKTQVEDVKTNVTSPNYTAPSTTVTGTVTSPKTTVTTPTVTTPTVTTTTTTAPKTTVTTSVPATNVSSYESRSVMTTSGDDVPPNAVPGKCYARCQTEDQYNYVTKQVINTPKTIKKIELPALFSTVYDTVITRPQSTKYETVPAIYETIQEQKMVAPATTKWIKGKADAGCLSANPEDCQVMCLVEVPAQYTTVTKKVLKQEAFKREIVTPMEYKIVAKQIKTQNERFVDQEIPATYKTVQERVLVSKGSYQGWKEVLCGSDLTEAKISQIQVALKNAGFNPGPIDNIFGEQTKAALIAYQKAKGLPVGNLNIETLKSLGVN